MNLAGDGELELRRMQADEADYATLSRWLSDPRVLEYYEGRDNPFPIERVRREYSPQMMALDGVVPCFFTIKGDPVGYVQYGPVDEGGRVSYQLGADADLSGLYGIDLFIGVPEMWGTGLGTRGVRLLLRYLFENLGAREVILDPNVENPRAIRCYEKCGFRKVKLLRGHEVHEGVLGDCWLMSVRPVD